MLAGRATSVSGITTPDTQTVVFTLAEPSFFFLSKLTYPTSFVVDRNQLNRPNWFERPNGTGPFKLTEYRRGDRIVLERNDNYVGATPPSLSRVVFYLSGAAITRYENDEIDISPVSLIDIDRVRDPRDPLSRQFVESSNLDTSYIGMNVTRQPFDDVNVRRAFNYATDKGRIANVVLRDLYNVAAGIIPPGMPGYNKDVQGLTYDPVKARAELAQSKYRDARGMGRIVFSTSGQAASLGPTTEAIIQNWKDNLGVEVEIQQTEYAIYLQDLSANKFQLFEIGWSADYADPQNFLDLLLYSKSSQNTTKFNNADYDRLIEAARREPDQNRRFEIYRRAEQLAVDQAPWIPLFHSKTYEVVKPYVQGYTPKPMSIEYLSRISIDRK
jgi:oligopeptide transport system substrate-binding protein